jgi:uncharacterized protein (TIGR00725 family)
MQLTGRAFLLSEDRSRCSRPGNSSLSFGRVKILFGEGLAVARKPVVGVVGTGANSGQAVANAKRLGELLAAEGWIVLSGGRNAGVMKAVSAGAKQKGGLTIGLLPTKASDVSPDIDVAIITDMNNARNNLIGLSSNVVIACGIDGPGTASEVALALKNDKNVILLGADAKAREFFKPLGGDKLFLADTPEQAVTIIKDRKLC